MTLQCLIAAFWVEQRSHSFAIDEHPPLLLGFSTHFCLSDSTPETKRQLCAGRCVWFLCSWVSVTQLQGLRDTEITPWLLSAFQRQVSFKRENSTLKKHAALCTSLLSITECSVAPLHPDAKLSKEHQWLPCDKTQFGLQHWQERTLKATEETNTTTGCGSVCRNNPEFYRQVFLLIYNAVKAVLAT